VRFRLSDLERLLDPAYVGDVSSLSTPELRAKRDECERAEVALSYTRRMVHGRLDIVYFDLTRRSEGREPEDLSELVDSLSEILGKRIHHSPDSGRLTSLLAPDLDEVAMEELDSVAGADRIHMLPQLDDAEVRAMVDRLTELEDSISDARGRLHDVIDRIHREIVRRYRSGETDVDELLGQ
jgi:hypothetical protein